MENKVVYNACFGGFSLSIQAAQWLLDNGIEEPFRNDLTRGIEYANKENIIGDSVHASCFGYNNQRHHPLLVQCVETLGADASGKFAALSVAHIDTDKYYIEEYDGTETVHTPTNIDWVTIPS